MSEVACRAATKVLYEGSMVHLNPALVGEMVAAALAAHDTVITATERNLHRQMWEDTRFREGIERRLREQLLGKAAEVGYVPVALPTRALRYFADPPFGVAPFDMRWRPVLPELVELGAPWESIEVELSVPARRVESLEQPNSHATHAHRGEPPVGAQP